MREPNPEQARVLERVKARDSVLVDAVPGSGKTTCALQLARSLPKNSFILVTFSKTLCDETRAKVRELQLTNIRAYTFHGLASKACGLLAHDTETLESALLLADTRLLRQCFATCTDLIVDEAQDVCELFFRAWCTFVTCLPPGACTHVMGDARQGVYAGLGADARFLTRADTLLGRPLVRINFHASHRLTTPMTAFVNRVLVHDANHIRAAKPGPPVVLWRATHPGFKIYAERAVAHALVAEIVAARVLPEDVFVLFPSVRHGPSGDCAKSVSRELREAGIRVYASYETEDAELSSDLLRGKVVLTTHHQSKGRERRLVIVFGCDISLLAIIHASPSFSSCPDQLFVAATRGTHELWVVQTGVSLPCVAAAVGEINALERDGALVVRDFGPPPTSGCSRSSSLGSSSVGAKFKNRGVTDLVRFIRPAARAALVPLVDAAIKLVRPAARVPAAPSIARDAEDATAEFVADINGVAVAAACEYARRDASSVLRVLAENANAAAEAKQPSACRARFDEAVASIDPRVPSEWMHAAAAFLAVRTGHWHKLQQLPSFSWGDAAPWWDTACSELDRALSQTGAELTVFEVFVNVCVDAPPRSSLDRPTIVEGCIDAMSARAEFAYELKLTSALTFEHKLQVMLYAYMWRCKQQEQREHDEEEFKGHEHIEQQKHETDFRLLNLQTGEEWRVQTASDDPGIDATLQAACTELLRNEFPLEPVVSDSEFLLQHVSTRERIGTAIAAAVATEDAKHDAVDTALWMQILDTYK